MAKETGIKMAAEGSMLTFTVPGQEALVLDLDKVSVPNRVAAEVFGWKQRIMDAAALSKGATLADKWAAMKPLVDHYASGSAEWRLAGGGGGRTFDVGIVILALVRVGKAKDVDEANTKLDALAEKKGLDRTAMAKEVAKAGPIAEAIARIRAERAPAGANDLLAEME